MTTKHIYNWVPDLPDHRDFVFAPRPTITVPTLIDLRGLMPPVYDQGELGSCTANAWGGATEFLWMKKGLNIVPSRLFVYYCERAIENTIGDDSGAQLRDGAKALAKWGVCYETEWPYDVAQFATVPTSQCYIDAEKHKAVLYHSIPQNLKSIKSALASGYPVPFGISVYESFESDAVAANGIVPLPLLTEQLLGGHAVLIVGYDDSKQWFIVRNSWGSGWGDQGYFYLPYAYVTNPDLADDFWILTSEN